MTKTILVKDREVLLDENIWEQIKDYTISLNKKKSGYYVYFCIPNGGNPIPLHRFVVGLDNCERFYVDHRNRNPLDNRRDNLRIVTQTINQYNQEAFTGKLEGQYKSIYKGVSWNKVYSKWYANISYKNQTINLGLYQSEIVAAIMYNEFLKIYSRGMGLPNTVDVLSLSSIDILSIEVYKKNVIERLKSRKLLC